MITEGRTQEVTKEHAEMVTMLYGSVQRYRDIQELYRRRSPLYALVEGEEANAQRIAEIRKRLAV